MSAGLAASTVTPGITAPDASLTTPASDACANAAVEMSDTPTNTNSASNANRIHSSLLLQLLHHRTYLPGGGSRAVVELFHQGRCDLFLTPSFSRQRANTVTNRGDFVAMLQEFLAGQQRPVPAHEDVEIDLRELVERAGHVGPVPAIAVIHDLRDRVW